MVAYAEIMFQPQSFLVINIQTCHKKMRDYIHVKKEGLDASLSTSHIQTQPTNPVG